MNVQWNWRLNHYQPAIPEKYHSFIAFDIVTCALVTIQTAKCLSYLPHKISESQFSYIIMIVPTCITLIYDIFLHSFVLWWYFNITIKIPEWSVPYMVGNFHRYKFLWNRAKFGFQKFSQVKFLQSVNLAPAC